MIELEVERSELVTSTTFLSFQLLKKSEELSKLLKKLWNLEDMSLFLLVSHWKKLKPLEIAM